MTDTNIFSTMAMADLYIVAMNDSTARKVYKQRVAQLRKSCSNAAYDTDNGNGIMYNFSPRIHKVGDRRDSLCYHYY